MTLNIITHSSTRKTARREDERRKASLRRHNKFKHRGSDCADSLKKLCRCLYCNGPGPLVKAAPVSDWDGWDAHDALEMPQKKRRRVARRQHNPPFSAESPGYNHDRIAEAAERAAGDAIIGYDGRVRSPETSGKYDAWSLTMHCGSARRRAA